jgi:tRNA wybutosine-synthesizing protein 4
LPFQFIQEGLEDELFIDIDYPPLIKRKTAIIRENEELSSLLKEVSYDDGPIAIRSRNYIAIACDLSNIQELDRIFREENLAEEADFEFIAEISITYMEPEDADAVIKWAAEFECCTFVSCQTFPQQADVVQQLSFSTILSCQIVNGIHSLRSC